MGDESVERAVRQAATGDIEVSAGRPRAIGLRGARVVGSLDLESATLVRPLLLRDCYFDEHQDEDRQRLATAVIAGIGNAMRRE